MATYTYFLAELTTGRVVGEVALAGFSGERNLAGDGAISANLHLGALTGPARQDAIDLTAPGRFSIVADRDGMPVGEWVIWKRTRANDSSPVGLFGKEFASYLDRRQVETRSYAQVDQISIAESLVFGALQSQSAGVVTADVGGGALSGVPRDRVYLLGEASVGQRLAELGQVLGGFDYQFTYTWQTLGGVRYIARRFQTSYPRAGFDRPMLFEQASPGQRGGNMLAFSLDEDATGLADQVFTIGASDANEVRLLGVAQSVALTSQGYPFMQRARSWTDVSVAATINAKARDLLAGSASAVLPPTMVVLADGDPGLGEYQLGDRVRLQVGPSINFPVGYATRVRILGWTVSPPAQGPELVTLTITDADDVPGDE